jgi:hypothetical protein
MLGFSDQLPIIEVLSRFVVTNKLGTFRIFLLSDLHVSSRCDSGSDFFYSLIFCLSLVCSIDGSSLALWDFVLIGTLRIGLSTMALVMVGRGDIALGVDVLLGALGVGC